MRREAALHDLDNTRRFIDRVRGFGAKVAPDGFGARYTSFSYLNEVGVDCVQGVAVAPAQDPAKVLAAQNSASFITDPEVLRYVRGTLAPSGAAAQLDMLGGRPPAGLR